VKANSLLFISSQINAVIVTILVCFAGCSGPKYQRYADQYKFTSRSAVPDYSSFDYWAAHPWKKDPSDSLPKALRKEKRDSLADVFFIYPTTYTEARAGWNADINDVYINAKTDYSAILYQASVFNQHCRIFSPRYRQAHLSAFFTNSQESRDAFDTAYADLKKAFEFYLEHYNHGRPIIIAGHSQGGMMSERLLKEFFDGKPLQQKLIVAYLVGWPIPQNSFEHISVCNDSLQTGCFCGWRTFKKGYVPEYVGTEPSVSFVTNPLSWKTNNEYVDEQKNKGSILRDFEKVIPHATDAQIHDGVLWSGKPKFPGAVFYRSKNYHIADINLFYMNIRENVEQRIRSYYRSQSLSLH
jgi:hypothetical protein